MWHQLEYKRYQVLKPNFFPKIPNRIELKYNMSEYPMKIYNFMQNYHIFRSASEKFVTFHSATCVNVIFSVFARNLAVKYFVIRLTETKNWICPMIKYFLIINNDHLHAITHKTLLAVYRFLCKLNFIDVDSFSLLSSHSFCISVWLLVCVYRLMRKWTLWNQYERFTCREKKKETNIDDYTEMLLDWMNVR